MSESPRYWCVVPAAGVGKRMALNHPKQYLTLSDKTVCEHTLQRLLEVSHIEKIVVCLGKNDGYWSSLECAHHPRVMTTLGGAERCDSVLNGLMYLQSQTPAKPNDWVLVHDVARPCVRASDIENLIAQCTLSGQGGILATPVRDTLKRVNVADRHPADNGSPPTNIAQTVDRTDLWQALTPQMFRLAELQHALAAALAAGATVTDEASAMEWQGVSPLVIAGNPDNIKITHPDDIRLATLFLEQSCYE